jgi:F0F1-type ATP synthase membrane subunit c/vacuolar-type H+-ATPase subunit K
MKKIILLAVALAVAVTGLSTAQAQDLTYSTRIQTGDSALVRDNKANVAITRLEFGNSALNITANGTNNITNSAVVERLVVGTAGATSAVVISDVAGGATNVIATIGTTNQNTFSLGVRISGVLRAVTTGGTPANVTLIYR